MLFITAILVYLAHDGTNNSIAATIRNNIILSPKAGGGHHVDFMSATSNTTGLTFDYNLYYPDTNGGTNMFNWKNVDCTDFADWKNDSSGDANSLVANPLFLNAGGSYALDTDFKIQSTSPCIDAGTDVGLTEDYAGNHIVGAPDIGGYEYQFFSNRFPRVLPYRVPYRVPERKGGRLQ